MSLYRTLWPLFHYLPGEIDFDEAQWDGYYRANVAFANAIRQVARDGDMIWVQDYHLMLLPALLREALADMPDIRIGFFLHTPFPSSEVYRVLPVRKQILLGVLQCDLIGFHTYDYARHFLSSCSRILGLQTMPNGVEYDGRFVHVGTFPIGIDPDQFINSLEDPIVQEKIQELQGRFAGKKIIVGVDRLDYIKGVPHKLHAFDLFLTRYPEFQGKVALLQVAVPTRTEVEEYKNLRTSVNELVGRINGKFGTFEFTPVQYLYRSVSFPDLVALYRVADVCVVTSTRDGMNLVSYEYIATQKDKNGTLILSEFAGAAQSMNGAIIINPWNIDEIVEAYREALTTSPETAAVNHKKLFKYVSKHTASYWGQSFVCELQKIATDTANAKKYKRVKMSEVKDAFINSKDWRLILVGEDEICGPALATQENGGYGRPDVRIIASLSRLANTLNTLVYVLSSRQRSSLEEVFAHSNVGLVCEHGSFIRHPMEVRLRLASLASSSSPREDWIELASHGDESWREKIAALLKFYTDHTPGSFMEEREKIVAWHFGNSDQEFVAWQAAELQANLEKLLSHAPVSVSPRKTTLEIRPSLVDKSAALRRIIGDLGSLQVTCDFVLGVEDGVNDDTVFTTTEQQLQDAAIFTITIGKRRSTARYYVDSLNELTHLLAALEPSN